MSEVINVSRRAFLKSSALAGGGLVLGVYLPERRAQAAIADDAFTTFKPNAFVRIGTDDSVTVLINHSEMGQGTFTSLPMLVAEELDADWSNVRAEHAPAAPAYFHVGYGVQMVGGSTSVRTEWQRLRQAGATARAMLVSAAAEEWLVDAVDCRVEDSRVHHDETQQSASFGELAEAASHQSPPTEVKLKDPKDFKLIGKSLKRLDTPDKTNGKAIFGLDVNRPGMLVAVVARPPVFGGKLKSFDAAKAKAMPGVRHVIEIDRGVAVVADRFWQAKQARDQLAIEWDDGALGDLDSDKQRAEYAALAEQPGAVARNDGDATTALENAAKRLEVEYDLPYLAHATMEPLNCVADVRADSCEVWTGTQFQTADQGNAANICGLSPSQVKIHTTLLGGGFGRRAVIDSHFVSEAVQISKAIGAPVKVVWTREDDTRGGYYRPRSYHKVSGAIGDDGAPLAYRHSVVCQSFMAGTPFEQYVIQNGVDHTAVEGAADLPYAIPNVQVNWNQAPGGVPTLWWRSVGHSHNAFVVESFIDELAHAAGKDPVEYRRALLGEHPRNLKVLELAAEKAGWGDALPEGQGRGIAVHESFGSFLAQVAEVSVSPSDGTVRVHRVVCAIDCGPVVNPEIVAAQMESGIVFGLTATLYGQITFANGRVQQGNFHDYPMLRMNEMPVVETHIVRSTEALGGVGEPGVPPVAPAVANAIFDATGKRLRSLPVDFEQLRAG